VNELSTYILLGSILLVFLIFLSWTDIKSFRLPNTLTLPLIILGVFQAYLLPSEITASIIGAVIGYLVFFVIEIAYKKFRKIDGLGRGDAKLLAAGGAWCGWMGLPYIVLIGSGLGIILALLPKYRSLGRIPFGPCLALGIFMVWTAGAFVKLQVDM